MKDLDFKIAQLIIHRIDGDRITDPDYHKSLIEIAKKGCGGFIIFGGKREMIKDLIARLHLASGDVLFIASDIEAGVARQIADTTRLPCQMALASVLYPDEEDLLFETLDVVIRECVYVGINMPLIPVLDVNQNPQNPIISTRAFSDKPDVVSWFVVRYIKAFSKFGLLLTGKHFPGHGDTDRDSHIELPIIKKSPQELSEMDLKPFITAINSNIPCIMVGHLYMPSIDNVYPSSLSYLTITNLLKGSLGFNGLVMTDAMNMSALKNFGDIYTQCLLAGNHIILHPNSFDECLNALKTALHEKRLPLETVEKAFYKVRDFKSKLIGNSINKIDWDRHMEVSKILYSKAITLVVDKKDKMPLRDISSVGIRFFGDYRRYDTKPLRNVFNEIDDSILKDIKTLIIAIFTTISAWHGNSGISQEDIDTIRTLLANPSVSVVISFGNPYVLRHFYDDADILIAGYEQSVEAQKSAIECLTGKREFNHHLPVTI
ncbi:MAG: glycoside hydrolase family 3 N-terminal domain-containing protein [Thermodesulfovibrionales bacterium]